MAQKGKRALPQQQEEKTHSLADLIDSKLNQFCKQFQVGREDLARALDRDPTRTRYGYLCRSRQACATVLESFRRDRLPELAAHLKLSAPAYDALVLWSAEFVSQAFGIKLQTDETEDAQNTQDTKQQKLTYLSACDSAEIGLKLFGTIDWKSAKSHMERAWNYFRYRPPETNATAFPLIIRCLSQYASLCNHQNHKHESREITRLLLLWLDANGREPLRKDAVSAMASAYIGAGITTRLLNPMRARQAVGYSSTAVSLLEDHRFESYKNSPADFDIPWRHELISAWRDQAKPLCFDLLAGPRDISWSAKAAPILNALDQAQRLCGEYRPRDENQIHWLLTNLTRMECLASLGEREQAQRLQENLLGQSWVESLLSSNIHAPVTSKAAIANLAVSYCRGGFSQIDSEATKLIGSLDEVNYAQRCQTILAIQAVAQQENDLEMRKLFVR